jgi:hypothetical protein
MPQRILLYGVVDGTQEGSFRLEMYEPRRRVFCVRGSTAAKCCSQAE